MKKHTILIGLFFCLLIKVNAQTFEKPIAAKQSHPELEITQVERTDTTTIFSLKITNKLSTGGWFCADKNIYIKNSTGNEMFYLVKSENIPTCPNQYEFSYTGQFLEFKLYFPKISEKIQFIDLIEDCDNSCFSFNGIVLDNKHNQKIRAFEKGLEYYQNNELEKSIPCFERVLEGSMTIQSHIYGLSYYYLILIYHDMGNLVKVDFLYKELLQSDIEEKETFQKELENRINL